MSAKQAKTNDGRKVLLHEDGTWTFDEAPLRKETEGLRNVLWGMSISEVKNAENSPLVVEDGSFLLYETEFDGVEFRLGYVFSEDKLVRASYMLSQELSDSSSYEELGDFLRMMLLKKYGPTSSHEEFWTMSGFENAPRGDAILAGALSLFTKWESSETRILLGVSGSEGTGSIGIEYRSVEHGHLEEENRETQVLNQL